MNKKFLLVAAICAAMNVSGFAQENLAAGAIASASSNSKTANLIVDNNTGTRWEVNTGTDNMTDGYWVSLDLNEEKEFNLVQIVWEGGYAKKISIYTADKLGTDNQPVWNETPAYTSEEYTLTGFPNTKSYKLDTPIKTRYIKIKADVLGNNNYFSMWEVQLFKYASLVSTFTELKANKNQVNVGDEFKVSSYDQFNEEISSGITYTVNDNSLVEDLGDGKYKALKDGDITITAKEEKTGITKTVKITAIAPTLNSIEIGNMFVKKGEASDLNIKAKDQAGNNYDLTDAKYSVDEGENANFTDGKFTADNTGIYNVNVTANGKTATGKVYVFSDEQAPTEPTTDKSKVSGIYGSYFNQVTNTNWQNWDGAPVMGNELLLNENKVKGFIATNGKYGITDLNRNNSEGYTDAYVDIYASEPYTATLTIEGVDASTTEELKTGWNTIHLSQIPTGEDKKLSWFTLKCENANNTPSLISNVYLYKGDAVTTPTISDNANSNGFYTIKGYASSAEDIKDLLTNKEIAAYDLTGLQTDNVEFNLKPTNENAIILVSGSLVNGKWVASQNWGNTKNVVVLNSNTWYMPTGEFTIEDNSLPVFNNMFISAAENGYKYTRSIAAKKFATVYLPLGNDNTTAEIPAGCIAYAFDEESSTGNTVNLKKVDDTTLKGQTPYIIYNGNDDAVEIQLTGKQDFYMTNAAAGNEDKEKDIVCGNLTVHGTYSYRTGAAGEYGLSMSTTAGEDGLLTMKQIGNAHIVPFRVYFTVNGASASAIRFVFSGETTGINDVNADTKKTADIYSADGRLVKKNATSLDGLDGGIYIMNGKKYVVK